MHLLVPLLIHSSVLLATIDSSLSEWRSAPKRVTAERGSDLSLSCTFPAGDRDDIIVQWLYQNITEKHPRNPKNHWRPLFLNTQALTPTETRYSIQQKIQHTNQTSSTYSTILTLAKITQVDEGLYMCKALSPTVMEMMYNVRVIESLEIYPKQLIIPANEIGQYSIRLHCVLTDHHRGHRHHEISWWHNNRRLGSQTNRYARIVKNVTQHSFISTLFYTGEPTRIAGSYICESDPLRRSIVVKLETNNAQHQSKIYSLLICLHFLLAFAIARST